MPMVLKLILLFSIQLLFNNCSSEIHKENENNEFYELEDIFSEDFMKYYDKDQSLELIKSLLSLINVDDSSNWKGDIHNLIKKTANICSNSITQAGNELDGLLIDLEDSDIAKDETYNFIKYFRNERNQVKDINVLTSNNKERESNFNLSLTSETEDLDKLPRKAEDSFDITKNLSYNFIDQLKSPSNEPHNHTTDTLTNGKYENSLFKKLISVPEEFDKSIEETHNDIKEIIKSILNACFDLPSTLPKASARHKRSPDNSLSKFAISLSNWATTSINNIEEKLDRFLTHCFQHETCKNRFNDFIKTSMELMISSSKDHNRTKVIIENILADLKNSNLIEFEFSNRQDTIVGKGEYLREFKEEESHAFEIAKNIHFRKSPEMLNLETEGEIFVELDAKIFETDERFLSLALGSSIIEHKWGQIKYKSADFFKLASALSPAMLRVGGSAANFLTYDPHETSSSNSGESLPSNYQHVSSNSSSGESLSTNGQHVASNSKSRKQLESSNHPKHWTTKVHKENSINKGVARSGFKLNYVETCDPPVGSYGKVFNNFTMTDADWSFLRELSELLDWPLLFDLNQFKRTPDGFWDVSNAELIIKSGNLKEMGIMWQVGNEPNNYHHHFNISITPEQSANDYKKLRTLLDTQSHREKNQIKEPFKSDEVDEKPRSIGNKALVVGPDVTRPKIKPKKGVKLSDNSMEYLEKFLSLAAEDIDVISWHHYYMNGRTSSTEDFVTVEFLDEFPLQVQRVKTIRDEKAPGKPIWITETATAYGGGAPQISDRYAACLPWMDKLGSAAFGGIAAVFRQTLYGGCYALLSPSLKPYPTYWASYVYKRLVGPGVLLPRTRLLPKSLRVYSHCLSRRNEKFKPGSVVIMGLNLSPRREAVKLDANSKLLMSSIYSYKLTAPENVLNSSETLLNGELLQLDEDGKAPAILGVKYIEDDLIFSPYSVNFWVFPDANATACR